MKGLLYGQNPMGTDFDVDEWANNIPGKSLSKGEEGLSIEEVKEKKTRKEIRERKILPNCF
jgi:hypothetical protein